MIKYFKKFTILFIFTLLTTCFTGCTSKDSRKSRAPSDIRKKLTQTEEVLGYKSVSAEEAKKLMDSSENYIILDVRTEDEYNSFHIKDAILIPDYDIKIRGEEILTDKSQTIFVYCRSGRRSKLAAKTLADMGYSNIIEFGGIVNWPYEIVEYSY